MKCWKHTCDLFVYALDAKQAFEEGLNWTFYLELSLWNLFEKLWQTEYIQDRIFFSCFYYEIQKFERHENSYIHQKKKQL